MQTLVKHMCVCNERDPWVVKCCSCNTPMIRSHPFTQCMACKALTFDPTDPPVPADKQWDKWAHRALLLHVEPAHAILLGRRS